MEHDNHTRLVFKGKEYQIVGYTPGKGTIPYGYLRLDHADGYCIHVTPDYLALLAQPIN